MEHDPAGRGGERGGVSLAAPQVVVIGGPNGAGKSSVAARLLPDLFGLAEFVNADTIATGLAGYAPERVAFAAGRIMLARLHELAEMRADFAFETTMSSRTFIPWLRSLKQSGYVVHMIFVWVQTAALAKSRVRQRIAAGGHSVPPEVVERRYHRGVLNFLSDYSALADNWRVYDNSREAPELICFGHSQETFVENAKSWHKLKAQARS